MIRSSKYCSEKPLSMGLTTNSIVKLGNNVHLVKTRGAGLLYHLLSNKPVVKGVSNSSINQPTNGKGHLCPQLLTCTKLSIASSVARKSSQILDDFPKHRLGDLRPALVFLCFSLLESIFLSESKSSCSYVQENQCLIFHHFPIFL